MPIRTETKISYGFRDRRDGKFMMLDIEGNEGRDFCGSETVRFTTDPWRNDATRYEVDDPFELIRALREDPHWYNSTRERPSWNGVQPEHLLPVRYEVELDYDREDGDPVARRERALLQPLPARFEGPAYHTRGTDQTPGALLNRLFGDAWTEIRKTQDGENPVWADLAVVDTDEYPIEIGMTLRGSRDNTGQVEAVIEMPESWPRRREDGYEPDKPSLRLVLFRMNRLHVEPARDFMDSDFENEPTGPAP